MGSVALLCACGPEADDVVFELQGHSFANSEWSAPVNVGPSINSAFIENTAELSPDELSLYFASNRPGGVGGTGTDIWVSRRACRDCPWGAPANLAVINSAGIDGGAALSIDGHLLFFGSDRPGGQGRFDIYVSWRADPNDDLGWSAPVNLGSDVNTPAEEALPAYLQSAEDGAGNLYFSRGPSLGSQDIFYAPVGRDGVPRGPAVVVPELNASDPLVNDASPSVRGDGREILFHSARAGGPGAPDMWVSTRRSVHDSWSAPVVFPGPLNTAFLDQQASLSKDGRTLLFTSLRPGGEGVSGRARATSRRPPRRCCPGRRR